jgi:hypothetical protein
MYVEGNSLGYFKVRLQYFFNFIERNYAKPQLR